MTSRQTRDAGHAAAGAASAWGVHLIACAICRGAHAGLPSHAIPLDRLCAAGRGLHHRMVAARARDELGEIPGQKRLF